MDDVSKRIAQYVLVLRDSLIHCRRAEDRPVYEKHLAQAAIMLAEICLGGSLPVLKGRIVEEKHSYGWSYLSYEEGEAAESAFVRLASFVDTLGE